MIFMRKIADKNKAELMKEGYIEMREESIKVNLEWSCMKA